MADGVYVPCDRLVFAPATILSSGCTSTKLRVLRPADDAPLSGTKAESLTLETDASALIARDACAPASVEDLTSLENLHEASVLWALRERFFSQKPYTMTGAGICVAVNPYRWLEHLYEGGLRGAHSAAAETGDALPAHA